MKPVLSPAHLLLLALLTLLVFGNCGGGVRRFLSDLGSKRRQQLRSIVAQNQQLHATARQQLRGRARHDEDDRIERYTNARLDSLLPTDEYRKFANRRAKAERQLRQHTD